MGVEIAITVAREETRVAVLDGGVVTDLFGDRAKHKDFVGNIYKGKVAKVLPGKVLFEIEGVKLTFSADALTAIAKRAIKRKTGARGLRSIMEGILLDTMYDLPGLEGVEQVVIGPEVVEGKAKPLYIYAERAEKSGVSA